MPFVFSEDLDTKLLIIHSHMALFQLE